MGRYLGHPQKNTENPPQVGTGASSNWKASKRENEGGGGLEGFFFKLPDFYDKFQ